jgi:hypothetical protein
VSSILIHQGITYAARAVAIFQTASWSMIKAVSNLVCGTMLFTTEAIAKHTQTSVVLLFRRSVMDHVSQNQPLVKPTPVGTSIQSGADALMALIEAERVNAAALARDQFRKLEQMFNAFRQRSMTIHAANQAQLAEANQNIQHLQYRLAQSQPMAATEPTENASQLAVIQPGTSQYDVEALRAEVCRITGETLEARREEAMAKRQFEELQTALQRVGIGFSREQNSLRFEAGWAVVLAEIEGTERGLMNPDELQQMLGNLTQRLQSDREKIKQLGQRLLSSEKERELIANTYENTLASLRRENSVLQGLASSKSSGQHIDSFQSPHPFPAPPVSTAATSISPQVPHSSPLGQAPWNFPGTALRAFLVFGSALLTDILKP